MINYSLKFKRQEKNQRDRRAGRDGKVGRGYKDN